MNDYIEIIEGMWIWVWKSGSLYGGLVKEEDNNLYIRDNGEDIGLVGRDIIIMPAIARYPGRGTDD